ncbi:MAG: hypothetical protein KBT27_10715, partial [Prevotellaceae bacterium]|nr:hypothetical protein [Candidatus Faecinaster equi]
LGANKAYMTLDDEDDEKTNAFTFLFNDGTTTGIRRASSKSSLEGKDCYDLNGMRVNGKYGGVIIKNGKKVFVK